MRLRLLAALAAEAVGVAQKALELGVAYVSEREQFGKKIGTYQAVSHPLADTYVETELARSLAYWAAWCVAEEDERTPVAVAVGEGVLRRDRGRRLRARRSRCTAGSASPGSTSCTATTSARSGSTRSAATPRSSARSSPLRSSTKQGGPLPVPKAEVLELMRMNADPAELDEIRELWKEHSKAEDNRSIEGLLATLSEDCVYTVYPDDVSWHGHEGAARFYTELLTAFPDIVFELQNIVIGPQGVVEEAIVTGTHSAKWLDNEPTGETMTWRNAIFFPWDPGLAPLQGRARLHRHAEEGG